MKYDGYYYSALAELDGLVNRINELKSCQVNYILDRQNYESGTFQIVFIDNHNQHCLYQIEFISLACITEKLKEIFNDRL